MIKTLFEKIVAREIPAQIIYEDDLVVAFSDVRPVAPTHILIVPRKPIPRLADAVPDDQRVLGHLLLKAAEVADRAVSGAPRTAGEGRGGGEEAPSKPGRSRAADAVDSPEPRKPQLPASRGAGSLRVASRRPPHPRPLPQGEGTAHPALLRV